MEVLTTLLPLAAPLRLLWTTFRRVRAGASVPLIAGGGVFDTSVIIGVFTFSMNDISGTGESFGSAKKCSLLVEVLNYPNIL